MKPLKWLRSPVVFIDLIPKPIIQLQKRMPHHILSIPFCSRSSPTESSPIPKLALTQEELTQINLLIPRLCVSDHLTAAIDLVAAALLANPPPNSISVSILVHSLTLQPNSALPMSLLTRLKYAPPAHPRISSVAGMLVSSYLHRGRPKDAIRVYKWIAKPMSVCSVERRVYEVLVCGLCKSGMVVEGLRVLRDMVNVQLVPGERVKRRVVRSLLTEAMVEEARDLGMALDSSVNGSEEVNNLLILLDGLIRRWAE